MYLEKISSLPKKFIKKLEDVDNLNIYLVQDYNLKLLNSLVDFSVNIFGEASLDEWGMVPQIRRGNVFVLKEDIHNKVMGIAILMRDWDDADKAYLFDFAISEDYQGLGVGFQFLKGIIENLIEQNFLRINLTVDVNNEGAIHLYQDKLGFKTISREDNEFGKDEHRFVMELDFEDFKEKFNIKN
ncbi:MAG: GNAT family N-acetyltransferase [Firmicutes bacterium]|nr:GNAT family N-acetyltransferase [Bacillota bacterium]